MRHAPYIWFIALAFSGIMPFMASRRGMLVSDPVWFIGFASIVAALCVSIHREHQFSKLKRQVSYLFCRRFGRARQRFLTSIMRQLSVDTEESVVDAERQKAEVAFFELVALAHDFDIDVPKSPREAIAEAMRSS